MFTALFRKEISMNQRYCNGMIHVIKKGDNLYQLSRKYRIPLALILRANPYVDVYNLQVGQEICIPVARPYPSMGTPRNQGMTEDTAEADRNRMSGENSGEVQMTNENRETTDDGTEVYVSDGTKSLGEILRNYEIALSDFLGKNDLDKVIIAADVVLYLPKKV